MSAGLRTWICGCTAALLVACVNEPRCGLYESASCACGGARGTRECLMTSRWGACDCSGACVPGATRSCTCGSRAGAQTCVEDFGWLACSCPQPSLDLDGGVSLGDSGLIVVDGALVLNVCVFGCRRNQDCHRGNTLTECGPDRGQCATCNIGEQCVGQQCVAVLRSGFSLVVVSASVPDIDPSMRGCSTWDCGGGIAAAPDPYVRETRLGYRTSTIPDTLTPTWSETVAVNLDREQLLEPMSFEIVDRDFLDTDDPITRFNIQLRPEQVAPGRLEFHTLVGSMDAALVLEIY